jgi:hypothetical protein
LSRTRARGARARPLGLTRSGTQMTLSRFAGVVLYLLSGLNMSKATQTRRRPACVQMDI